MESSPQGDREIYGAAVELPLTPRMYYELVRRFNKMAQTKLTEAFSTRLSDSSLGAHITLVTPGSDGRLEKGSLASPLEIIALVDEGVQIQELKDAVEAVFRDVMPEKQVGVFEVKRPSSTLSFFHDNPKIVQPGRIADSRIVYGDAKVLQASKVRLGEEIQSLPRSTIVERVQNLERDGRNATNTGRNRMRGEDVIHFDLEDGKIFYNPQAFQFSFKIGPLRFVQNKLLAEAVKHTRNENDTSFISTLASGIVPRLSKLSDDRMLNLEAVSTREVTNHYAFFLRLYHQSEQLYVRTGETVLQLTEKEKGEVAKRLVALSEILQRLKIERQKR